MVVVGIIIGVLVLAGIIIAIVVNNADKKTSGKYSHAGGERPADVLVLDLPADRNGLL